MEEVEDEVTQPLTDSEVDIVRFAAEASDVSQYTDRQRQNARMILRLVATVDMLKAALVAKALK